MVMNITPESKFLEELLSVETSKRQSEMIADLVINRPALFKPLVYLYLRDEEPLSRRAVWVVDIVTEKLPSLLPGCLPQILERLSTFTHDGMKRQSLRMITRASLSKKQRLVLIPICFDWLTNHKESVAVKIFSMEILSQISQAEPDLRRELADSIEWRMAEETAGFRNRGEKILKKLNKEMNQQMKN
jgi:hypothetical protein